MSQPQQTDLLAFLLEDADVLEIMIDRYDRIYVERRGKLEDVQSSPFRDEDDLVTYIRRLTATQNMKFEAASPIVDLVLDNPNARATAVLPPVAENATLVIRKLSTYKPTLDELTNRYASLSPQMAHFLAACVQQPLNILVTGGTGSGKTTVLNVLADMIPPTQRVIKVDSGGELNLSLPRLVNLRSYQPGGDLPPVTLREVLGQALKMRPDRIILSEIRGDETITFLQAMGTGHDGCMSSLHATGVRDALSRLELLAGQASPTTALLNIREMIADNIDLITYQQRLRDGTRRIMAIHEVIGMSGDNIQTEAIFVFEQTGEEADGRITGQYVSTGYVPQFTRRLGGAKISL